MKLSKLAFLMAFGFVVQTANAQIPDIKVKMSKVDGEQYRCLQSGGGFALKTTEPVKIWQVDANRQGEMSSEGLDLEVSKFTVFRCAHCFAFEAGLKIDKKELKYKAKMTLEEGDIKLKVTISGEGESKDFTLPCQFIR